MFERTITGLDLGTYSVKAAELKAGLRNVEFLRFEEALLPQDAPPEEVEATIYSFLREKNISLEFVVAAVSSDRLTQRHLRFPFSDPRRVRQAVPFEVEGELPVPLETLLLGHESVLVRPEQTDVLAVMCPRSDVGSYLNELRLSGLEPRILEADGAVLANLSASLDLSDVPRLFLDVGHSKTNLVVLVDGRPVALRSIPIGGRHLTRALAKDLRLEEAEAERVKLERGVFADARQRPFGPETDGTLGRLVREVARSLQSVVGDALQAMAPSEILLIGGSAALPGLHALLTDRLRLPCHRLEAPAENPEIAALESAGTHRFAQAAALALRGSTNRRVTSINFRQEEFSYQPDLSALRRSLQLTIGLVGLALVLWIGSLVAEVSVVSAREGALKDALAQVYGETFPEAPPAPNAFAAMQSRMRETRELAEHLGVTGTGRSGLDVLQEISVRIPPNLDIALTELNIDRRTVQARGYAQDFESVDKIRKVLSAVDWFSDVRLSDVVNDPRRGGKTFSLTIRMQEGAS
jgi:type IV pilus assembly protein PilM